MSEEKTSQPVELEISTRGSGDSIILKGEFGSLHNDPQKVQQLLDLLDVPRGTEVHVVTRAASVIVR
jgi:hypothetical protein